jgi:hypothetical protein
MHTHAHTVRFGIWPLVLGSLFCTHFGGLLSICSKSSKIFLLTLRPLRAASGMRGCNVRANRLWHWLLYFRVDCNHAGLVAKRADWRSTSADLWRTRSFVCSARAFQGQWQSRPAGAYQSGRRSKDITTLRWMGSVRLVVSLLPSAFRLPLALRGSSGEAITDEAWSLGPGKDRWHIVRSRELELLFGR